MESMFKITLNMSLSLVKNTYLSILVYLKKKKKEQLRITDMPLANKMKSMSLLMRTYL